MKVWLTEYPGKVHINRLCAGRSALLVRLAPWEILVLRRIGRMCLRCGADSFEEPRKGPLWAIAIPPPRP